MSATGENRKSSILSAARELFVAQGFDGTTLEMIIARAGGSRRNIYALFGDKEQLMNAVVEQVMGEVLSRFDQLPCLEVAPQQWLTEVGERLLRALTNPEVIGIFRQFIAMAIDHPHLGIQAWARGPGLLQDIVARYFVEQTKRGVMQVRDPKITAQIFIDMIKGDSQIQALMTSAAPMNDEEMRVHVSLAVHLFLNGTNATHQGQMDKEV